MSEVRPRVLVPQTGEPYTDFLSRLWKLRCAPRHKDAPTVVSTFAGCGGSSLGYAFAGYRELLAVEWDKNAAKTFQTNFSHVPVHVGDIGELGDKEALRLAGVKRGELSVFDGSPPCQGFSMAGKRLMDDPRNQLFRHYVRLLRAFHPRAFVMENVYGMVKGKMRAVAKDAVAEMRASGYDVRVRVLNAKFYGVPQSRSRTIFVGIRNDLKKKFTFPMPVTPNTIPVSAAIRHLGNVQNAAIGHIWEDESPNRKSGKPTKAWTIARTTPQGAIIPCSPGCQVLRDSWNKPASCLTTGSGRMAEGTTGENKGTYIRASGCHPLYTRAYSVLEYKILGGFPVAFDFHDTPKGLIYKQIGNCVPPPFIYYLASAVAECVK